MTHIGAYLTRHTYYIHYTHTYLHTWHTGTHLPRHTKVTTNTHTLTHRLPTNSLTLFSTIALSLSTSECQSQPFIVPRHRLGFLDHPALIAPFHCLFMTSSKRLFRAQWAPELYLHLCRGQRASLLFRWTEFGSCFFDFTKISLN